MKSGIKIFLEWLLAVTILGAFGWGVYLAGLKARDIYFEFRPSISPELFMTSLTIISAILLIFYMRGRTLKSATRNETMKMRVEMYENLIRKLSEEIVYMEEGVQISEEAVVKAVGDLSGGIITLASGEVIDILRELTIELDRKSETENNISSLFESLFMAIRKDIGHAKFDTDGKKLLELFTMRTESVKDL